MPNPNEIPLRDNFFFSFLLIKAIGIDHNFGYFDFELAID